MFSHAHAAFNDRLPPRKMSATSQNSIEDSHQEFSKQQSNPQ